MDTMSEQSEYCQGRNKLKLRVTICGFPPIHIYISDQQLRKAQESYPSFLWSNYKYPNANDRKINIASDICLQKVVCLSYFLVRLKKPQ